MIDNEIKEKNIQKESMEDRIKVLKIYDMVAHDFILCYENLLAFGFSESEIKNFIDNKILVEKSYHQYEIAKTNDLTAYGIKQLLAERYIFAQKCIAKCYALSENKREYITRLLMTLVKFEKYQEAMEVYSHLEVLECNKEKSDYYYNTNIMYLYLLNMLTICGQRYQNIIDDIDQDLMLKEIKKLNLSDTDNEIRKCIILNKFKYAFQLVHNKIKTSCDYTIDDQLLRQLLCNTVDLEEKYKRELFSFLETEEYQKIFDLLEEKRKHRYLNNQEMYACLVVESIINIKKTGIIPIPKTISTTYMYDAIKNNNYVLAQKLNREFLKRKHKSHEKDLLDMLLTKINYIMLKIKLDIENEESQIKSSEEKQMSVVIEENNDKLKVEENNEINETEEEKTEELLFAEELAYYIKTEKISINEAKKKLGINNSQVLLIKLIYARDYFSEGMETLGNEMLKEVEKSKEKTNTVIALLNEIRRNKKFYKNRTDIKIRKKQLY